MAGRELLIALYAAFCLLKGFECQNIVEQPLDCYQSSLNCISNGAQLTYSQCCATGEGSFLINGTCYACAELLSFTDTSYTVNEGAGYARIGVQLQVNPLTDIFIFNLVVENTNPPSALAGIDYGPFPDSGVGLIHLVQKGEVLERAGFVVFDDDIVEHNERLQVRLQPLSREYLPLGSPTPPVSVTIMDNDQVDITPHPPGPVSVVEGADPSLLTFFLNKTGVAVRNVDVEVVLSDAELAFSDGGAQRVVTFEPNDVVRQIQVRVVDDAIVESTENHSINLRVPEGETGVNLPQDSVIINVEDNDFVTVNLSLSLARMRVPEADGSVEILLFKTGENERPVRVRVFTEDLSAQSGADYSPVDMVIDIPSDVEAVPIQVNITADGVVENEESFRLNIRVPPDERAVLLGMNSTSITLLDSDVVTVGVDVTSLQVTEGGEQVYLNVLVVEGALNREVDLSLNLNSGDVSASESTVTFGPGRLNVSVAISADDDVVYEGEESAELTITSSDTAVVLSVSPLVVDIVIEDNDSPQLSFSEAVYQFNESSEMGTVVVTFDAPTETAHTWTLTSVSSTATEGVDFSAVNVALVFDDVMRERAVSFTITDDNLSEGLESFMLELRDSDGEVVNSSVVQIVDDEELLVSFVGSEFTVSEGEKLFYLELNKSGITTFDIAITINLTDITAIGGTDYGFFPTSEFLALTLILADETGVFYPIPIIDDDIIENVESISAQLLLRNGEDSNIVLGDITAATIFIEDNDKLRVFLTQTVGSNVVPESDTTLRFRVSRDEEADLDRDVTVTLTTTDGTATAGTNDYVQIEMPFTFTPTGPTSFDVNIDILDDQTVEATENFIVRLTAPIDGSAVQLPENDTVIYIIDNDKIQVEFAMDTFTISEGVGVASITLNKAGTNEIPVMVSVVTRTVDDTAEAGRDYNATIQPVEFQMSEFQLPLDIPIVDDSILEITERFTVILEAGDDSNVELGPRSSTTVFIIDNDFVSVGFEEMQYEGTEGDDVTVRVVMSDVAERDVAVGVSALEDTATANDYSLTTNTITIPRGATSRTLLVSLVQDTMCEEEEERFTLHLSSSEPSAVRTAPIIYTSIIIREDDICGIEFMNETVVEVLEPRNNSVPLTLCVGLTGDFMFERDVQFVVVPEELTTEDVDEQALLGLDFSLVPTLITLRTPDRMICFDDVSILSDSRPERSEMFNVSIVPQQGLITGRASEITVIITDQEGIIIPSMQSVQFSAASYTVQEADGVLEIELVVSPPIQQGQPLPIVVFTTVDGTAISLQDYSPLVGETVTLVEGAVTTVSVVIEVDGEAEGIETFTVQLSLLEGALIPIMLGDITTATVTIVDITGDVFVNDTVTGDPFFVVPLALTPDSHSFEEPPALCFEIHGSPGSTFNLISDTCTSVNALYQSSTIDEELNFIGEIGVRAVDLNGECITVRVPVSTNCFPEILREDGAVSATPRFDQAGISVRRSGSAVRVSVPNCASSQLVMWIKCRNISSQPQLRFDITRGLNLNPTSHGLLGQFWNIPVRVTRFHFTGQVIYDLQEQELYLLEVQPADSTVRRFVAEFYPVSWDRGRPEPCLYAGDQQGGRIREIRRWNDPVIENNYRLYRTSSLFDTDFRFSMFQSTCTSGG